MIQRALPQIAFSDKWGRQMRFITGPRQSGKTTIAKAELAKEHSQKLYYLWDLRDVRRRYRNNQLFFTEDSPPSQKLQWVCFDEIHKVPKWKNILKAIFDSTEEHYRFIITGSAKLEIFRKAGDSLSGRYFMFHLFPVCLAEFAKKGPRLVKAPNSASEWIGEKLDHDFYAEDALSSLLEFSGFPEPLLKHSGAFRRKWSEDYLDTVIREDIGALTRIIDKEYLYELYQLLPEMVSNPISELSIASHLELSPTTIKNHLRRLEDFYLAFKIHPYSKNIKRALIKAPKCYLYDWTWIQDPGKRFENYVACELLAQIHLWMDLTGEHYSLFYIRQKDKKETDFLILKNESPWLLIEAKYSDGQIDNHHFQTQAALKNIPLVQVCRESNVSKMQAKNAYRISASRFFA